MVLIELSPLILVAFMGGVVVGMVYQSDMTEEARELREKRRAAAYKGLWNSASRSLKLAKNIIRWVKIK